MSAKTINNLETVFYTIVILVYVMILVGVPAKFLNERYGNELGTFTAFGILVLLRANDSLRLFFYKWTGILWLVLKVNSRIGPEEEEKYEP